MRRADRLFQIVQLIRGRRLSTAAFLAERLEVSQRTIYRDVADLQHQGVPIEGEAGVGYRLGAGFELPPLMFSQGEANALVAAARLAQAWLDPGLAREVEGALGKILSVLPPVARLAAEAQALYAPLVGLDARTQAPCRRCARRCKAAMWWKLTTPMYKAAPACADCGRWAAFTGARCGPCRPGASCATTSGAFASTALRPSRYCPSAFGKSPAKRWPTCCARWRQRGKGGRWSVRLHREQMDDLEGMECKEWGPKTARGPEPPTS